MKTIKIILAILISGIILNGCCKGCDEPILDDEEHLQRDKISHFWKADAVGKDGVVVPFNWESFTLDLQDNGLFITEETFDELVFPKVGQWNFSGTSGAGLDVIVRSDGIQMTII